MAESKNLFSHRSGGKNSEMKVPAELISSEGLSEKVFHAFLQDSGG